MIGVGLGLGLGFAMCSPPEDDGLLDEEGGALLDEDGHRLEPD